MKPSLTAKELTTIAIFIAVTAVMAQIAVPLPFTPMPISFGLVAVYMTGILMRPKHAILTQIGYLLIGALGAPVFGNFRGGIGALFGATGGYLLMYPIMAGIVAMALNSHRSLGAERGRGKMQLFVKSTLSICAAHILLYLGGTAWLSITTGNTFAASLALAVYPFIPLDIAKIAFCVAVIVPLRTRMRAMNLLLLEWSQAA